MHSYPIGRGVSVSVGSPGFGFRNFRWEPSASTRFTHFVLAFLALLSCASMGSAAVLVHEFYLPMPEAQVRQAYGLIETNLSNTLDSAFSVVVTGDGTVIYYDQWEDGYETDLAHPAQSTTQVWGDGNNANGIAP